MKLACRVVKLNLPELNDDIRVIVANNKILSGSIFFYCANELAKQNLDKAESFLASLDGTELTECCEKMLNVVLVRILFEFCSAKMTHDFFFSFFSTPMIAKVLTGC